MNLINILITHNFLSSDISAELPFHGLNVSKPWDIYWILYQEPLETFRSSGCHVKGSCCCEIMQIMCLTTKLCWLWDLCKSGVSWPSCVDQFMLSNLTTKSCCHEIIMLTNLTTKSCCREIVQIMCFTTKLWKLRGLGIMFLWSS